MGWGSSSILTLKNVFSLRHNAYFPVDGGINIMHIILNSTKFRTTVSHIVSFFISIAFIY